MGLDRSEWTAIILCNCRKTTLSCLRLIIVVCFPLWLKTFFAFNCIFLGSCSELRCDLMMLIINRQFCSLSKGNIEQFWLLNAYAQSRIFIYRQILHNIICHFFAHPLRMGCKSQSNKCEAMCISVKLFITHAFLLKYGHNISLKNGKTCTIKKKTSMVYIGPSQIVGQTPPKLLPGVIWCYLFRSHWALQKSCFCSYCQKMFGQILSGSVAWVFKIIPLDHVSKAIYIIFLWDKLKCCTVLYCILLLLLASS